MNIEKNAAKRTLIIGVVALGIAVAYDIELARSIKVIYALAVLLIIQLVLCFRLFMKSRNASFYSVCNDNVRNKCKNAINNILVFSILSEVTTILIIANIINAGKLIFLITPLMMVVAFSIQLINSIKSFK